MTKKNINIELSEEDFQELKRIKDKLGTTWENMLKRGNTVGITLRGYARRKDLELMEEAEEEDVE